MKHSPTPWSITDAMNENSVRKDAYVIKSSEREIALLEDIFAPFIHEGEEKLRANADHIVKCVNNHDALITAVKHLLPLAKQANPQDAAVLQAETLLASVDANQ